MIDNMCKAKEEIYALSVGYYKTPEESYNIAQLVTNYLDSLTKPVKVYACECKGWGCRSCCSSDAEIRSRQGVFG